AQPRGASITSARPARAISGASAGHLAIRSMEGGRRDGLVSAGSARDTGRFPKTSQPGRSPGLGRLTLLAGGGNAYADEDQNGRRRQADHQRHLGRRKASLVL